MPGDSMPGDSMPGDSVAGDSVNAPKEQAGWPLFDDWVEVNGAKAELVAGNYRVEALKELLRRSKYKGDEPRETL